MAAHPRSGRELRVLQMYAVCEQDRVPCAVQRAVAEAAAAEVLQMGHSPWLEDEGRTEIVRCMVEASMSRKAFMASNSSISTSLGLAADVSNKLVAELKRNPKKGTLITRAFLLFDDA